MPHPLRGLHLGRKKFFKWVDAHLNTDGTLFDYAPTSVPTLMAISTAGARYAPILEKGLRTIETFQVPAGAGLIQSAGEASIGETYYIMNSLLDIEEGGSMLAKGEGFLFSVQQTTTGAWGFSKHNEHFPDADDSSNTVRALRRMEIARGQRDPDPRLEKAIDWILTIQNPDGGFGTWERDHSPFFSRLFSHALRNQRFDLSVSGAEQTARITLNLALFRDRNPKARAGYEKALAWLLKQQQPDGSFSAVWMVDYLFCTSNVLTTLATSAGDPAADAAAEKALRFVLGQQRADGGFSESPLSFDEGHVVQLPESSPAQTGFVAAQLLNYLREENYRHWDVLRAPLERAIQYLLTSQKADGRWHDPAWTAVTFPKLEYLIYPYIQEVAPLQAIGMYRKAVAR
jgi:squalene-hopene/tetraprenyl-beta-curcumene cyclase